MQTRQWAIAAIFWGWLAAGPATSVAQTASAPADVDPTVEYNPPPARPTSDWPYTARMFDVLPGSGALGTLAEHGIALTARLGMNTQMVGNGGLEPGSRFTGRLQVDVLLDSGNLKLWPGGQVFLQMEDIWNNGLTRAGKVGDTFGVDRISSTQDIIYVPQYWFQQALQLDDWVEGLSLRVRLGQQSKRDSFDRNAYAGNYFTQFLNVSLNNNQTIPFSGSSLGALLAVEHPLGHLRLGVFNAAPRPYASGFTDFWSSNSTTAALFAADPSASLNADSVQLWAAEAAWTPTFEGPNGALPGHYRVGGWYSNARYVNLQVSTLGGALPPAVQGGNNGVYLSFDQMLYKEQADDAHQGLGAFFRWGGSQPNVSVVQQFLSFGLSYLGPIPTRDHDNLGVGCSFGSLQGPYFNGPSSTDDTSYAIDRVVPYHEQVFEIYYRIQIFPWLYVIPDLQYIVHPADRQVNPDALVVGFRTFMVF